MMEINFLLKTETKSCYRFESGTRPEQITLYLKKSQVEGAGIDPNRGITVKIEQMKGS
jgi:hypothetical protein